MPIPVCDFRDPGGGRRPEQVRAVPARPTAPKTAGIPAGTARTCSGLLSAVPTRATAKGDGMNRYLLIFATAVLGLITCGNEVAGDDSVTGFTAVAIRPVHPVLIRNEHGPLMRVVVECGEPKDVRVTGLSVPLDGTDDLERSRFAGPVLHRRQGGVLAGHARGRACEAGGDDRVPRRTTAPARQERVLAVVPIEGHGRLVTSGRRRVYCHRDDGRNGSRRAMRRPASGIGSASRCAGTRTTASTPIAFPRWPRRPRARCSASTTCGGGWAATCRKTSTSASAAARTAVEPGSRVRVIMDMGEYGGLPQEQNGCSDPGIIVDRQTGEIFCFAVWMNGKPGKHQWNDDGSEPGFEIGKSRSVHDGPFAGRRPHLDEARKPDAAS